MKRYSVNDDFTSFFNRHGYVCLEDLFSPDEVAGVRSQIYRIFELLLSDEGLQGKELIAATYRSRRDEWRACAKQMSNSLAMLHLSSSPRVVKLLRRSGLRQPVLCLQPEVRVDIPLDEQYMQPWHQDWRSGQGSLNAVTIWLPLHDVCKTNGAIEILDGTHLLGLLDTVEKHDPRRFEIVDPRVKEASGRTVEVREGECILFSQLLVHRSGRNLSTDPRLTCQFRFADLGEPNFMKNLYRVPLGSELVWQSPPDPRI